MQVKEIMKKAITISKKATIKESATIMSKQEIGSLVVAEKNIFFGIVTGHDIIKHIAKSNNLNEKINKIMSKNAVTTVTINPEATLEEAASLMHEQKIRRLPVVEKNRLLGIITAADIVENADSIDAPFFF